MEYGSFILHHLSESDLLPLFLAVPSISGTVRLVQQVYAARYQ